MNSNIDLSVVKEENIKQEELFSPKTQHQQFMNQIRKKALDLCKKGQISLERMQMCFPTSLLEGGVNQETKDNMIIGEVSLLVDQIKCKQNGKMLASILNTPAAKSIPRGLVLTHSSFAEAVVGVFITEDVKKGVIFGPYIGVNVNRQDAYGNGYCWDIYKNKQFHHCLDAHNPNESNWMRYVNRIASPQLQNLEAFQQGYQVYYKTLKDIAAGTELCVWDSDTYNLDHDLYEPYIESEDMKPPTKLKTFKCNLCKKAFSNKISLEKHQRVHSGVKSHQCDVCNKLFADKSDLNKHRRTHTGEKPYQCDVCTLSFSIGSSLKAHKRTHTGQKPYNCDVCGRLFSQTSHLSIHKVMHTGKKSYKCDICGKFFVQSSGLLKHKRKHTERKRFECEICQATFTEKSSLYVHQSSMTNDIPYQCLFCSSIFTHRACLREHRRIHVGEKAFKCDLCKMSFDRKSKLLRHEVTHTGEKPFKCGVCKSVFSEKYNLKIHQNIHTGQNRFTCDICDKSFARYSFLETHKGTHLKKIHNNHLKNIV